jgi:Resolvase, N terminal domain
LALVDFDPIGSHTGDLINDASGDPRESPLTAPFRDDPKRGARHKVDPVEARRSHGTVSVAQFKIFAPRRRGKDFNMLRGTQFRREIVAMIYGYARVSYAGELIGPQVAALEAAGCDTIVIEIAQIVPRPPRLRRLLQKLEPGDVLKVTHMHRLGQTAPVLNRLIIKLFDRGAWIEPLDFRWAGKSTDDDSLLQYALERMKAVLHP